MLAVWRRFFLSCDFVDGFEQINGAERFLQDAVGPRLRVVQNIAGGHIISATGDKQDGGLVVGRAQACDEFDAIDIGHDSVRDDHIEMIGGAFIDTIEGLHIIVCGLYR